MEAIRDALFAQQDPGYAAFQRSLIPTVDPETVIGVRVPCARKLAKKYAGSAEAEAFLKELPHRSYDENMLHALLIAEERDYARCMEEVGRFLPFVDNWAVCDILSPKVFRGNKADLLVRIKAWAKSPHTYICRFGLGMLLTHFLDEAFEEEHLAIPLAVRSEEYYVNMMIAWFFATALAKQWTAAVRCLEENRLTVWTHNKAIQKARESRRISAEKKAYLSGLKRPRKPELSGTEETESFPGLLQMD